MPPEEFDRLVEEALDGIPEEFRRHLENVSFVVEDRPDEAWRRRFEFADDEPDPLGFYDGVPLGERTSFDEPWPVRDTIYVFREPLIE